VQTAQHKMVSAGHVLRRCSETNDW